MENINNKKSLCPDWYVQCKFTDSVFAEKHPSGFPFRKRLNKLRTLEEKKAAIEFYLDEISRILEKGYNPITKTYMVKQKLEIIDKTKLNPELMYLDVINLAFEKLTSSKTHLYEIRIAKNRFIKGAKELRLSGHILKINLILSDKTKEFDY